MKSRTSRTVFGESVLKKVELVVTRKPAAFAARMAATALSKTPSPVDRLVVALAQAVEVHHQGEVAARLEPLQAALEEHGVGAEVDVDLAADELGDHLVDVRVQQRLPACDRDHRGPALLHRPDHVLHRQALAQHLGRMLDLPAARTGQVAREQRLDLDDERVVMRPLQFVLQQVCTHTHVLP